MEQSGEQRNSTGRLWSMWVAAMKSWQGQAARESLAGADSFNQAGMSGRPRRLSSVEDVSDS